jgi:S1-C subfamily serine protease
VQLGGRQKELVGRDRALLVVGLTDGGPAESAGLLVGDLLAEFDGQPVSAPEDLLDLLGADRIGKSAQLKLLRGGAVQNVTVTASERTA